MAKRGIKLGAAATRADNTATLVGVYSAGGDTNNPLSTILTPTATQSVWSGVLTYSGYASGTSPSTMTATNLQNGNIRGTGLVCG